MTPTSEDTDGDGLEDDVEQLIGTKLTVSDTDRDDLSDGLEIELWYDLLDDNPDGDSYNDYEEYCGGTDPYTYDKTGWELTGDFIEGFFLGDFTGSESIPMLLGQITSGFVPVAADVRDLIANAGKGEWGYALLSVAGIVPVGGDIAKVVGSLGEFIAKNIDDAPMIVKAINEVSTQFPDIAKHLPASTFDDIAASLKNGQTLTKSEYLKLKEVFEAGGRNIDEFIELPLKYADEIASKITRIAGDYKNFECVECADDIMKYLKNIGMPGTKISLTAKNARMDIIYSNTLGEAISYNGKHFAIEYNGKVYDNIHKSGLPFDEWLSDFDSTGIISYVKEAF